MPVRKEEAVESLGQQSLLMPAWIKSALAANDRLKFYLSVLQSAMQHAAHPDAEAPDWSRDATQLGLHDSRWVEELPTNAYLDDGVLVFPQIAQLMTCLATDIAVMSRPVLDAGNNAGSPEAIRRDAWVKKLQVYGGQDGLHRHELTSLTHGSRKDGDSLHLLIMDLHKRLNALSGDIATETIDGAHVWQIHDTDRPLVEAFMRGLHRTFPLKFSHPGLDTAVTRDGKRLLIQNDIGTNDVHVLVMEVSGLTISLTYSDLHAGRFDFFREMLAEIGFEWTVRDPVTTGTLNEGKPYWVGNAVLRSRNGKALQRNLESVASRIVFVIDWNRARKRLQMFVRKSAAISLLSRAARDECGHMGWLFAGGERLVFEAMQSVQSEVFRVGDRLDGVIGESAAEDFLFELMRISTAMLLNDQPIALIADESRLLLTRLLRKRSYEFDLLAEHAALGHALAQGLCEALESGATDLVALASRAKYWEREADHVVMQARQRSERQDRWLPVVDYLVKADDVCDALEESIFSLTLIFQPESDTLPVPVQALLVQLAESTLTAIQDQVRAIQIARQIVEQNDPTDGEPFLQALWHMLRSERICDDLLRKTRLTALKHLRQDPVLLSLVNELAATIERTTDCLLAAGFALRQMMFSQSALPT